MEKKKLNIAIIGAGKWGQALYHSFSKKNNVIITSRTVRNIENFVSLEDALKYNNLIISISTQYIQDWMSKNFIDNGQNILVASKGLDLKSGKFLDEIYSQFIDRNRLLFLSGPSFADEVQKSLPTALIISSENKKLAEEYIKALPDFIKGYFSDDIIGVEVSGAYKNIIAIASGISDGLNLGNNAKAALISRGLVEMSRFGQYFGANVETFLSLSGSGDLFLTSNSIQSRNYRVGVGIAHNLKLEKILKDLGEVAEGVETSKALYFLSKKNSLYTPILNEIYLLIYQKKKPINSMKSLIN